jgi:hypothetical protein
MRAKYINTLFIHHATYKAITMFCFVNASFVKLIIDMGLKLKIVPDS